MKLSSIQKKIMVGTAVFTGTLAMATTAFANEADLDNVVSPIRTLIENLFWPLFSIVVAVGALYCIMLGVKFAKAEEPQEHEKAKTHLKNAIIGFVLIFVLLLLLRTGTPVLKNWLTNSSNGTASTTTTTESAK